MNQSPAPASADAKWRRVLPARRLALLASAAGLGATVLFVGPQLPLKPDFPTVSTAQAQTGATAMRPASFADIVEKVKPAVFAVRVKVNGGVETSDFRGENPFPPGSPMERFFRRFGFGDNDAMRPRGREGRRNRPFSMAQGSGFFISADGYAVTNNHVVSRGDTVEIKTDDGKTYTAKVVGSDERTDIALLKVEGRNDFPFVTFAEEMPRIGDWVLAVGNPFGLGGTVTAGIVSASGRDIGAGPYDDFIQIDAPVNRGNSGGPTFSVDGKVVGVNTAIYSPSGGNVGIAFAIPSETVQNVVAELKEHGVVTRGWLGVQIQPVTPEIADSLGMKEARGALVAEAQANSPAAEAGVRSGDVIVSVNGNPVKDARDLAKKIAALDPKQTVELGTVRDGSERNVQLTLGKMPNERQARASFRSGDRDESTGAGIPKLGLRLAPADSVGGVGNAGVVVTEVEPNGPAAERGFRTGDVILEVAGRTVSSPADVRKALETAQGEGKRTVLLRVKSGDATRFVAVPVGQA
ncbi:MAG TPA: Do family serine endopeptidase [Xanthobacteraceae bacterium]|nr:Do family serine endopeptidase [Xanthobacteraceae bacterium]